VKRDDNSMDLMHWETGIPGKENTDWAGGVYRVTMEFPEDYPSKVRACHACVYLYLCVCVCWLVCVTAYHILPVHAHEHEHVPVHCVVKLTSRLLPACKHTHTCTQIHTCT